MLLERSAASVALAAMVVVAVIVMMIREQAVPGVTEVTEQSVAPVVLAAVARV